MNFMYVNKQHSHMFCISNHEVAELLHCFTEIPMPSTQYHLEVKDTKTCSLVPAKSLVYGEALGSTEVILKDKS